MECPSCDESTTVLVPEESEPVRTTEVDREVDAAVEGAIWTRCEQDHEFLVHYD